MEPGRNSRDRFYIWEFCSFLKPGTLTSWSHVKGRCYASSIRKSQRAKSWTCRGFWGSLLRKSTTVQYFMTSVPYSSPLKFRICCSLSLCAELTSQPGFSGAAVMQQPHPWAGCRAESALRAAACGFRTRGASWPHLSSKHFQKIHEVDCLFLKKTDLFLFQHCHFWKIQ